MRNACTVVPKNIDDIALKVSNRKVKLMQKNSLLSYEVDVQNTSFANIQIQLFNGCSVYVIKVLDIFAVIVQSIILKHVYGRLKIASGFGTNTGTNNVIPPDTDNNKITTEHLVTYDLNMNSISILNGFYIKQCQMRIITVPQQRM